MKKLLIVILILGGLSYFAINAAATNVESQVSSTDEDYEYVTMVNYALYSTIGLDKDSWVYGSALLVKHRRTGGFYICVDAGYVKYSRNPYKTFRKKKVSGYKYYCKTNSGYYFF